MEDRDHADLLALDSDPQVMRYIGGGAPRVDPEATRALIERVRAYYAERPGLGVFIVERRADGRFFGWAALKTLDGGPEVEVGYRLAQHAWGDGVATEAARALVGHGFGSLKLDRILGVVIDENAASRRVLEKAGLVHRRRDTYYGFDVMVFELDRSTWIASGSAG